MRAGWSMRQTSCESSSRRAKEGRGRGANGVSLSQLIGEEIRKMRPIIQQ